MERRCVKKSEKPLIQRRTILLAGVAVPVLGSFLSLPDRGLGIVIRDGWILSEQDR